MRMIINRNYKTNQYTSTPQRALIMKTIKSSGGMLDAKKLFQLVSQKDNSISLATVYRTLNLFRELGIIDEHRLGRDRCCYELKHSPEHQHIMCKLCGNIIEFESPIITDLIHKLQTENDFHIEKGDMCIQGVCGECSQMDIKREEKDDRSN